MKCAKKIKYEMVGRADMGEMKEDLSETFFRGDVSAMTTSFIATMFKFVEKEHNKKFQ